VVESFFSTLKHELDLDAEAEDLLSSQQLQRRLDFWIGGYYNRVRLHGTIGYVSPIDYYWQFVAAFTLTPVSSCSVSTKSGEPHIIDQLI